jgi:hypothetical protein
LVLGAAAAAGARAIVPLIAAAANNGARYLIGVFMVVPRDRWVRRRRVRPASIVAPRQPGVVTADTNSAPRLAVMSREVGQAGDRRLASDGGVGSVMIVEVQPARQGDVALFC